MGSQTFEILRQGVWASLTGGWFYDPHQTVFCNTVHLYLWLFLLCGPFVTYLYFPKTVLTWGLYCLLTALTICAVKVINLALHVMYDEAQIISENHLKQTIKTMRETSGDEHGGGIEMQVLDEGGVGGGGTAGSMGAGGDGVSNVAGSSSGLGTVLLLSSGDNANTSNNISQANSAVSIEFGEQQVASTIDLKVDVHRKNSSESSDLSLGLAGFKATTTSVQTHSADICQTSNHRRSFKTKSKSEEATTSQLHHTRSPISEEGGEYACPNQIATSDRHKPGGDQLVDIEAVIRDKQKKKLRSKLQRQVSLDAEKIGIGHWSSSSSSATTTTNTINDPHKLQRHRSTENTSEHHRRRQSSSAQHFSVASSASHQPQHHLQSVPSDLYYIPDDEEDAYQQQTPMRKDSSSTMSALQLPTTSAASSASRVRRHSNAAGKPGAIGTVRRIKSAALETCCAQPSVSNLVPHPSSVETIGGGQQLRNPQHAILPPPSKCLVRNAHLNLFPQPEVSSNPLSGMATSDSVVYPIAELDVDERVNDSFHFESSESDGELDDREDCANRGENEYDIDRPRKRHGRHSTTSDDDDDNSDIDRPSQTQSTDSDTENNGSRSPLLDLKSRSAYFISKTNSIVVERKPANPSATDKPKKGTTINVASSGAAPAAVAGTSSTNGDRPTTKSEDSGCPSSDCDQASASSKDMLLTAKSTVSSIARTSPTHGFYDANPSVNIPGEGSSKETTSDEPTTTNSNKTVKEIKVGRSLGAIPKQLTRGVQQRGESDAYDGYVVMAKTKKTDNYPADVPTYLDISRTSSWSSLSRRCSAGSGPDYPDIRSPVDVLHETKTGWTVRPSTATNPAVAASRGDPPPLLPSYSRRPYVCFPPTLPPRQFQPKLRLSARSRNQSTSFDSSTTGGPGSSSCTRDDETLARTIAAWEYGGGDGEIRDTMGAGLMLQIELPSHHASNRGGGVGGSREVTSGANTSTAGVAGGSVPISLSAVEYGEAVFCDIWRHYNLPQERLVAPKRFYKYPFQCFGRHEIKIAMDRLQLLALLDRDLGWFHAGIGIVLAAAVSVLGAAVLRLGVYKDIFAFLFCFAMAGSQYSLLKSVQPDAASPIHGFNKTVAFSRPIYFCLCAALLILAHNLSVDTQSVASDGPPLTIFALNFVPGEFFGGVQYVMSLVLLCLPVFFSLGLFPQINTFLMYVLEQMDMHVFGGSAVCSLIAAIIGVLRSCLACLVLYGPAFGGLSEPKGTQHVLFSSFCALLVAVSYHLSRNASDVSCIWTIIKSSLVLQTDDDESEHLRPIRHRKDSSLSTELAKKLTEDDSPDRSAPDISKESLSASAPRLASTVRSDSTTDSPTTHTEPLGKDELQPSSDLLEDPLPRKLQSTVNSRLKNDFLVCFVIFGALLSLHCSTVFTVLQPELNDILRISVSVLGLLLHYIVPQMRKHLPWLWFAEPILRSGEHNQYEPHEATRVMWFEKCYVYACFAERNVLYPLLFVATLTSDAAHVSSKFGAYLGTAIVVVCGLKAVRSSYADPASQYLVVVFTVLLFLWDFKTASESFLVNYFVVAIVYKKFCEFLLKIQFIVTYIAPWQITWGSAFHAFAQPFSVPHSAMLFLQAAISAVLSTPLNPFLGSAIFLTSYVRPIKFWERDYNTRRIDHSNTRLSSQLERDLGADDNNLNSIFYEHLTRSLQHSLCGDLQLGRWGNVNQGDCFVLASDYLNCLVHIIEMGNGLCTFQMRGLEFRGTYCQQREVEAISEGVQENEGCCCCAPGHLPRMLSVNAMFSTRWLAWQVVSSKYVLEGYSISDNLAQATLQMFEFRKVLISYYVKSIIYYTIRSPKLEEWLQSATIQEAMQTTLDRSFVDLDPIFNHNLDADFDFRTSGITRQSFCGVYLGWIQYCYGRRYAPKPTTPASATTTTAAHPTTTSTTNVAPRATTTGSVATFATNAAAPSSTQPATKTASAPNVSTTASAQHHLPATLDSSATRERVLHSRNQTSSQSFNNPTPSPRAHKKRAKDKASKRQRDDVPPHEGPATVARSSALVSLLLCLGLLARRTLATASNNNALVSVVELFLHGLHSLFKGDFRITSARDEWVFADMDLLHSVVAPAVKMALKLHQDHFLSPEEYEDPAALFDGIETHTSDLVISHEADPLWRNAVLRGAPNLLALRHVLEDGSDEYRLIRLTKRYLGFRVIKVNRECVRGLWAGQQQELIYLRNRNPERGSIQNAKQALRNIINSSCDQPIGYPIYVSPLTTSYAETNEQLTQIVGGAITLENIHKHVRRFCQRVRKRCREGCSSGSATLDTEMGELQGVYCNATSSGPMANNTTLSGTTGTLSYGSQSLSGTGIRGSMASVGKPTNTALLAGLLNRNEQRGGGAAAEERERDSGRGEQQHQRGIKRRNSAATGRTTDRDRRATLPVMMTEDREPPAPRDCLTLGASAASEFRHPSSAGFMSPAAIAAAAASTQLHHHAMHLKPNSMSSGHLGARNARTVVISCDRKSKSEERNSSSQERDDLVDVPLNVYFPAPRIPLNRKVIIVEQGEIFDCLDLGRRIDVVWPSERMRLAGGQSSWREWQPQEGMVGFTVHYWQPSHPDAQFRSNFNRTIFLLQIGERFVPVGEHGVKEYNTGGASSSVAPVAERMRLSVETKTAAAVRPNDTNHVSVTVDCDYDEDDDDDDEEEDDESEEDSELPKETAPIDIDSLSEDGARGGGNDEVDNIVDGRVTSADVVVVVATTDEDSETGDDTFVLSRDQSI